MFRTNTIVEVVERGRQGERGERGQDGSIALWNPNHEYVDVNQKVEFEGNIYNLHTPPAPIGLPPNFDFSFWRPITGGVGNFNPNFDVEVETGQTIIFEEESNSWVNSFIESKDVRHNIGDGEQMVRTPVQGVTNRLTEKLNVKDFLDDVAINSSGTVLRHRQPADKYNPFTMVGWSEFTYSQLGTTLRNADLGGNVRGDYHLRISRQGVEVIEVGDAIYVTPTEPVDGVAPVNNNIYIVVEIRDNNHFILNRLISYQSATIPDGVRVYNVKGELDSFVNDGAEFVGAGWVGYPFDLTYVYQGAFAVNNGANWVWALNFTPNNTYGIEFIGERPANLFVKSVLPNYIQVTQQFTFFVRGQKFTHPPLGTATHFPLQNHLLQRVHICPNILNYDLTAYPNSYVIRNHHNLGFDIVVLFGDIHSNLKFDKSYSQMLDVAYVEMNDVGNILSVVDNYWLANNGSNEVKQSTTGKVLGGFDIVPNGEVEVDTDFVKYTFNSSKTVTSYLDIVLIDFPNNIRVVKLWNGESQTSVSYLAKDNLWYDMSLPEEERVVQIPEGKYGVDTLYCYENPNTFNPFYLVKGTRIYSPEELALGIYPEQINVDGYFPVAVLVQQGGLENKEYLDIVTLKGESVRPPMPILTKSWMDNLVAKTQLRTIETQFKEDSYLSVIGDGMNGFETGDPVSQGWDVEGVVEVVDVDETDDIDVALQMASTVEGVGVGISKDISVDIQNLFQFGGTLSNTVRVVEGVSEFGFGWNGFDSPDSIIGFRFPDNNTNVWAQTLQAGLDGNNGYQVKLLVDGIRLTGDIGLIGYSADIAGLMVREGNLLLLSTTGVSRIIGRCVEGRNDITVERDGNTINTWINGFHSSITNFGHFLPINRIGNCISTTNVQTFAKGITILEFSFRLSAAGTPIVWKMTEVGNRFISTTNTFSFTINNYDANFWTPTKGLSGACFTSMSLTDTGTVFVNGNNDSDITFESTKQGWFTVSQQIAPSPDGLNWGTCSYEITEPDGVVIRPPELQNINWLNNAISPTDTSITIGTDGGIGNVQLKNTTLTSYGDAPTFTLTEENFELNDILNIEGERDFELFLPDGEVEDNTSMTVTAFRTTTGTLTIRRNTNTNVLINKAARVDVTLGIGSTEIQLLVKRRGNFIEYRTVLK